MSADRSACPEIYASRYQFHDVLVGLTSNVADVVEAMDDLYEHFKVAPGHCALNLHVFVKNRDLTRHSSFLVEAVVSDSLDTTQFLIEKEVHTDEVRRGHRIITAGFADDSLGWQCHIELCIFAFASRNLRSFLQIHAACLADRNVAVVMPGNSGAGKTTLAWHLSQAGLTYLSDELALIDAATLKALPFPRNPLARTDVPLPGGQASTGPPSAISARGVPKNTVSMAPELVHRMSGSAAVRHIVFPTYDDSAQGAISEISASEGLVRLFEDGSILNLAFGDKCADEAIKTAARLVEQADCYSLLWCDAQRAAEVVCELVRGRALQSPRTMEEAQNAIPQ